MSQRRGDSTELKVISMHPSSALDSPVHMHAFVKVLFHIVSPLSVQHRVNTVNN
jgi:hypothetical protein